MAFKVQRFCNRNLFDNAGDQRFANTLKILTAQFNTTRTPQTLSASLGTAKSTSSHLSFRTHSHGQTDTTHYHAPSLAMFSLAELLNRQKMIVQWGKPETKLRQKVREKKQVTTIAFMRDRELLSKG